jgi:formylglycine-generating enzyme required for sulfatase activity
VQDLESELLSLAQMKDVAVAAHLTEKAKLRWSEAIEGIGQSSMYKGQKWPSGERLSPQAGLLPLGENPATGLWEFVHLPTGTEPKLGSDGRVLRDAVGRLSLTPETGVVLVLLPGGRVPKADSRNQHQEDWIPNVDLPPFFLSKYELTQEQWAKIFPRRDLYLWSADSMKPAVLRRWEELEAWIPDAWWLNVPGAAQWEYGCRARTATAWWTGNDVKSLIDAEWMDPGTFGERVGMLRGNGFGLHDVHGNLPEWCASPRDREWPPREGDGVRDGIDSDSRRSIRGNVLGWPAFGESANISKIGAGDRAIDAGFRPSRRITP